MTSHRMMVETMCVYTITHSQCRSILRSCLRRVTTSCPCTCVRYVIGLCCLSIYIDPSQALEELIYENQVNLFLCGHQHSFERTCQVYRNECLADGTGTVHIVVGTAGAGLESGGFSNSLGNFSVVQSDNWGYLRVYASDESMTVQFIQADEQSIYDEATLYPWPSTPEGIAGSKKHDVRTLREHGKAKV